MHEVVVFVSGMTTMLVIVVTVRLLAMLGKEP
jgi:hypothetical protein